MADIKSSDVSTDVRYSREDKRTVTIWLRNDTVTSLLAIKQRYGTSVSNTIETAVAAYLKDLESESK